MSSLSKSNIHCYCRLRAGDEDDAVECLSSDTIRVFSQSTKSWSPYFFDKVFNAEVSQYDIYLEFEPLLSDVLNGNHVSIFSFGESGAGKTYTLRGPLENPGLMYRLLEKLCEMNSRLAGAVTLSMIEIYENNVNDLLTFKSPAKASKGVTAKEIKDSQEILKLLEAGHAYRSTLHPSGPFAQNSHVITTAAVEVTDRSGSKRRGVINFIDLATSEWIEQRIPPNSIQSAYSNLCECLQLVDSLSPIPVNHSSKLTSILESSMTYNSQIILFHHLLPGPTHAAASLKLMNYHFQCQKQFHFTHQVSYLEKENQILQNRIYTLQLENDMLTQQVQAFQMAQQQDLQTSQSEAVPSPGGAGPHQPVTLLSPTDRQNAGGRAPGKRINSYSAVFKQDIGSSSSSSNGNGNGSGSCNGGAASSGGAAGSVPIRFTLFPNRPLSVTELQKNLNTIDLSRITYKRDPVMQNGLTSARSTVVGGTRSSGHGALSSRPGTTKSSPGRAQKSKSISLLKSAITPSVRANSVKGRRPGLSGLIASTVSSSQKKVARPTSGGISAIVGSSTPSLRKAAYVSPFNLVNLKK